MNRTEPERLVDPWATGRGASWAADPEHGRAARPEPRTHVVVLSAASEEHLSRYARRLRDHLVAARAAGMAPSPADVAFTLQTGRVAMSHRLAVRCADLETLTEALDAMAAGRDHPALRTAVAPPPGAPGRSAALAAGAPGTCTAPAGRDPAGASGAGTATAKAGQATPGADEGVLSETEAASAWLAGHDVAWEDCWPVPGARVPLPTYPFDGPFSDRSRAETAQAVAGDGPASAPSGATSGGVAPPVSGADSWGRADYRGGADPGSAPADDPLLRAQVEDYLKARYAEVSGIAVDQLHAYVPLEHYGLTSYIVARLNDALARDLGEVSPTLFFEHRDLAGVAGALLGLEGPWLADEAARTASAPGRGHENAQGDTGPAEPDTADWAAEDRAAEDRVWRLREAQGGDARKRDAGDARDRQGALVARDDRREEGERDEEDRAIAIVGIAGRYPHAPDLDRFWENLVSGRDCVGPLPAARRRPGWPADIMWGGFLDEVDMFDPLLFNITPKDAALMDPQERLFLEVTWEALEDAGYPRRRLRERHGSRVAVYAGSMYNEYPFFGVEQTLRGNPQDSGSAIGGIANRVSFHFDLRGPSMTVDTMCSSSLVAVHLAVQALRRGEAEMAIAGAVNLSLHPNKFIQQRRMKLTASDLRCRSFGRGGDGFVPSEGVGVVVLKPLRHALEDGDRVHAVIRGSSVVHMGRTNGWIVPNPAAQGEMVRDALRDAGVDPATIGYLEAHGAGTALGDPIEIDGLMRAFGDAGLPPGAVAIGSVKSSIGHVEAAAGIAGLTKVVLQMRHRTFAPSLHAEELNPKIAWDRVPFRVQRETAPWPKCEDGYGRPLPRRAGVSSFGAGGTIAHVVLEEYADMPQRPRFANGRPAGRPQALVLSGQDPDALRRLAGRMAAWLRGAGDRHDLADVAYTLQAGREPLRERLALVTADLREAAGLLARVAAGEEPPGVLRGRTPGPGQEPGPVLPRVPAPDAGHAPLAGPHSASYAASDAAYGPAYAPGEDELREIAAHWVGGGRVDWPRLHELRVRHSGTSQPEQAGRDAGRFSPRVIALPSYPFARMRCWLPERPFEPDAVTPVAASTDVRQTPGTPYGRETGEGPRTGREIPLYRKEWVPAGAAPLPASGEGPLLCVFDDRTENVARELARAAGLGRVLLVREGAARAHRDSGHNGTGTVPGDVGVLSYDDEAGAVEAVGVLLARHPDLSGWVDLCDLDAPAGPGRWQARLAMLQQLVSYRHAAGLRVVHVTRGLLGAPGAPATLAGARMAGFVRVLGVEYGKVRATVLDTDVPAAQAAEVARQVLEEWGDPGRYGEVCHRAGRRHEPRLVPVEAPHVPLRLAADAPYVLSGATRGIGARMARHLVERGARRIALVGARSLPPRERWDDPSLTEPAAAAVATVRELERLGAEVRAHTGKLSDRDGLAAFLRSVRGAWGPVAGVVHCAGRVGRGTPVFAHKGAVEMRAVLEPKADGLEALAEVCEADRPAFFLTFSSVCAAVPRLAAGVADYAAANAFMDFFVSSKARQGQGAFRSVNWPMWHESGSGRGGPNVCEPVGLGSLGDAEGLRVLERVLALPADALPGGASVLPCPPLRDVAPDPGALLLTGTASAAPWDVREGGSALTGDVPSGAGAGLIGAAAAPPVPSVPSVARQPVSADATGGRPPAWLVELFARNVGLPAGDLDPTVDFAELGVESVMLGELLQQIEEHLGRRLEPSVLLDHSTLERLAAYLARFAPEPGPDADSESGSGAVPEPGALGEPGLASPQEPGPGALAEPGSGSMPAAGPVTVMERAVPSADAGRDDATAGKIAVIGMACRFPGAPDVETYWANLLSGRCSVAEVPVSRWDHRRLYSPVPALGRSLSRWGGFLDGIEDFDAAYFGMGDEEATCLDPGIRLFLEATATCLADAGYTGAELWGRDVGVFVGGRISSYGRRAGLRPAVLQSDQNFIAAHVAHHFDFRGPNLVVDSACSSSLVSVQLACRALLAGDAEVAVAGGVEVLLDEQPYLEFSAARAISPSGRCATFDERADGFVPGEGCGAVLLKPLAAALADGDRVHAVIEAVAVNNDGHTMGITTPNPAAQADVIRKALAAANRRADEIGMVEAHGTGTLIGDPIELRALTDVYRETSDRTGWCAIGSVKSNVGHLLSAAGAAGLIKVVLAVEHGQIPPTLFCETPNPRFDFDASPFFPNTRLRTWAPGERMRVAGLSSFGLGGTNAHLVAAQLDPRLREGAPAPREPLPAPVFRRKRLWLGREADPTVTATGRTTGTAGSEDTSQNEDGLVASLLELSFTE
ncbi:type I polyketide synthase [Microbispora hainanensis]|uniref:type I polyketide synthase n=1 Tax=Microbispora hainanensis TaxID=568844 RepID=UPI0033FE4085